MTLKINAPLAIFALAACTSTNNSPTVALEDEPLLHVRRPPALIAAAPADIPVVEFAAVRLAAATRDGSRDSRRLSPRAAPLLHGSPEGRRFLSLPGESRALAIGAPPRLCPARAAASGLDPARESNGESGIGPDATDTRRESPGSPPPATGAAAPSAANAALSTCFAQLAAARAPRDCGCELIAVNRALIAPGEAYDYAPGVSARIVSRALKLDLLLVAAEAAAGPGRRLTFYPAPGDRLTLDIAPDGAARAVWRGAAGAVEFTGTRRADGLRRGRYAERFYLSDPEGRRLRLLIGYEPVEYAVRRRELTRWPADG